jgi:hypothetical protein
VPLFSLLGTSWKVDDRALRQVGFRLVATYDVR